MRKKVPLGIKVLSIGAYLVAALCLILGLIIFLIGYSLEKYASQNQDANYYGNLGTPLLTTLLGIGLFFVGIIFIFIGIGLWKGKRWARTLSVINTLILILAGILEIIFENTLAGILVELIIIGSLVKVIFSLYTDPEYQRFFDD